MDRPVDRERLIAAVTEQVMAQLRERPVQKRFLVLGKDASCPVAACLRREFHADVQADLKQADNYDFAVVPTWYLARLRGQETPMGSARQETGKPGATNGNTLDFREHRLLHERELRERCTADIRVLKLGTRTIVTALAADFIKRRGLTVERL